MEMKPFRVRLKFHDFVLTDYLMSERLNRSWVLVQPEHRTISDLSSYLLRAFNLSGSCPHGIILSLPKKKSQGKGHVQFTAAEKENGSRNGREEAVSTENAKKAGTLKEGTRNIQKRRPTNFTPVSLMAYNVFYTSIPVLVSVLDKDLSERTVMQHPQILFYCQAGRILNPSSFAGWFGRSLFHLIVIAGMGPITAIKYFRYMYRSSKINILQQAERLGGPILSLGNVEPQQRSDMIAPLSIMLPPKNRIPVFEPLLSDSPNLVRSPFGSRAPFDFFHSQTSRLSSNYTRNCKDN